MFQPHYQRETCQFASESFAKFRTNVTANSMQPKRSTDESGTTTIHHLLNDL